MRKQVSEFWKQIWQYGDGKCDGRWGEIEQAWGEWWIKEKLGGENGTWRRVFRWCNGRSKEAVK